MTRATTPATTPATTSMRAIVQDTYGSADVLRPADLQRPQIKDDEVLVAVRAAGLDRGTWHLMTGKPYAARLAFGLRRPKQPVPGLALAGEVVSVGAAVTRFAPGDEVYGVGSGALAEYAAAREAQLARKPANQTFEQAAAVPVSASTALQALDAGRIEAGQRVLVTGASGGVGSFAVQLATAYGAEVTGVSGPAKLDLVRSLGAAHVLDYTRDDFADGSRHWDLIIDLAGNPSASRLRRALARTGTAVITGGEEGGNLTGGMGRQLRALFLSAFVSQRLVMIIGKDTSADLERLTTLIEAGQVTPSVDRSYPLEQVPDAMRQLAAGEVRGKVVVTVR